MHMHRRDAVHCTFHYLVQQKSKDMSQNTQTLWRLAKEWPSELLTHNHLELEVRSTKVEDEVETEN